MLDDRHSKVILIWIHKAIHQFDLQHLCNKSEQHILFGANAIDLGLLCFVGANAKEIERQRERMHAVLYLRVQKCILKLRFAFE